MKFERKLEILKALTDDTAMYYPADRIYRDGANAMATNGWQLLAFHLSDKETASAKFTELPMLQDGAKAHARVTANSAVKRTPTNMRSWLTRKAPGRTVDFMDLLSFLRNKDYTRCLCCAGSGRRPVTEGWEILTNDPFNDMRPVEIGGVFINGNLLIARLAHLPKSETVEIASWSHRIKAHNIKGPVLRIKGDGWTLIQMHLCLDEPNAEVFEPAKVNA